MTEDAKKPRFIAKELTECWDRVRGNKQRARRSIRSAHTAALLPLEDGFLAVSESTDHHQECRFGILQLCSHIETIGPERPLSDHRVGAASTSRRSDFVRPNNSVTSSSRRAT